MKNSKKTVLFIFIAMLCAALCACGVRADTKTDLTVEDMAAAVIVGQEDMPVLYAVNTENDDFDSYVDLYFPDMRGVVDKGIICTPSGAEASEIAVFMFQSEVMAENAESTLRSYIRGRVSVFEGYAPEQAAIAQKGRVVVNGRYAALLICPDPVKAQKAFLSCFGDEPPAVDTDSVLVRLPENDQPDDTGDGSEYVPDNPEDNPKDDPDADAYDSDAVLDAWKTGDVSLLSERELAVLNACDDIINSVIKDGMREYEKELAIHDVLIERAEYDPAAISHIQPDEEDPDNDNPYGLLIHGKGICLGYSSAFQLLMDMLDIECVTVFGYSGSENDDHAWNMVCLDGEWYCVDVTWDDPISSTPVSDEAAHRYFNVTSDFMRRTDHKWDESDTPEATGVLYAWDSK